MRILARCVGDRKGEAGMNSISTIAKVNIGVAIVVLALKSLAAWLSGSVALFSDAVESVVNVVTALAAWGAIAYAQRPPDHNHPYGHQKAEYFVALGEAVMIGAAGWAIAMTAWDSLATARPLDVPAEAYAANIAAGILNGAWCWFMIREGRRASSVALEADGWHLFSDVVSSAGVLAGVVLAQALGIAWLDAALAIVVAGNILWSGWRLLKVSVGGLMDVAPSADLRRSIEEAIQRAGAGALQAHDLKSRVSGPLTFVEFHLVMPGETTVSQAHEICDRIEAAIRGEISGARISIHVEPEEKAHKHGGIAI
jgi:cation diffusion facilitator family transporter